MINNKKNYNSKNYSNSVKINFDLNSKDINNNINNYKSQLSSISTYKSKEKCKININKLDYVPPEFLKEKKRRRILKFII